VIADRARGLPWAHIAERHGVTERQCRNIWSQRRQAGEGVHGVDWQALVLDAIATYEAAIEDLACLADSTGNDAVKLGAIKARVSVVGDRLSFLRTVGLLPSDPQTAAARQDMEATVAAIFQVFDRYGLPDEAADEVLEIVENGGTASEHPATIPPQVASNGSP
jgi:hypothetical protein